MSAVFDEEKKSKDPENRMVSHFPRQRLSIEESAMPTLPWAATLI